MVSMVHRNALVGFHQENKNHEDNKMSIILLGTEGIIHTIQFHETDLWWNICLCKLRNAQLKWFFLFSGNEIILKSITH